MKTRQALKNIFRQGAIPQEQDYHDLLDSYRHISDPIPQSAITGLETTLQGLSNPTPTEHTHTPSEVTGLEQSLLDIDTDISNLQTALNGKAAASHTHSDLESAISGKAAATHTHADLESAIAGKAAASHQHTISDITNLQSNLNLKASVNHTHSASQITGLTQGVNIDSSIYVYQNQAGTLKFLPQSVAVPATPNTIYYLELYGTNIPSSGSITIQDVPLRLGVRGMIAGTPGILGSNLQLSNIYAGSDYSSVIFKMSFFRVNEYNAYLLSCHCTNVPPSHTHTLSDITDYTAPASVQVTPILTSGTKIATIGSTDIYAPEASSSQQQGGGDANGLDTLIWAQFGKMGNATGNCAIPVLLQGSDQLSDMYDYSVDGGQSMGYGLSDHCRFYYNGKFYSSFDPSFLTSNRDYYFHVLEESGYSGNNCIYWKFLPDTLNPNITSGKVYLCQVLWADYDSPDSATVPDGIYFRSYRYTDPWGNVCYGELMMVLVVASSPYNIQDPNVPYFMNDMRNLWLEYDDSSDTPSYRSVSHDLIYFDGRWYSTYDSSHFQYDESRGELVENINHAVHYDNDGNEISYNIFYEFTDTPISDYADIATLYGLSELPADTPVYLCKAYTAMAPIPASPSDPHRVMWWDNPETGQFESIRIPQTLLPNLPSSDGRTPGLLG